MKASITKPTEVVRAKLGVSRPSWSNYVLWYQLAYFRSKENNRTIRRISQRRHNYLAAQEHISITFIWFGCTGLGFDVVVRSHPDIAPRACAKDDYHPSLSRTLPSPEYRPNVVQGTKSESEIEGNNTRSTIDHYGKSMSLKPAKSVQLTARLAILKTNYKDSTIVYPTFK